ncbi:hypothetical protein PIB30_050180 [Stylosanthes scabra]|uniref:Uncharacterized protein n=1 Tax=Stylosanthes scabra TaxID=79078 RepID=A0ABU6SHE3_9FABA|nr:hypothetical protein [Stylosanthes scabra]
MEDEVDGSYHGVIHFDSAVMDSHNQRGRKTIPLFLYDEEFARCFFDTTTVAAKADACIRSLIQELDTTVWRPQMTLLYLAQYSLSSSRV